MPELKGIYLTEVWDERLSIGNPTLYNNGKTWIVEIMANNVDEHGVEPLETHDTGILCEKGDTLDYVKVAKCYEWLKSVRDKYSKPNIEELKPEVAQYRENQRKLAESKAV